MKLSQKIAQLFILGFRGPDVSEDSAIARSIRDLGIGGVILFDVDMIHGNPVNNIESPEQLRELVSTLKSYSEIPLLVSIDQEGGLVNRLKAEYGFPATRSHQRLGESGNTDTTYHEAKAIAYTLQDMGINLNFAPVVDIVEDAGNSPIGKKERSFGSDRKEVIEHAKAYSRAHLEEHILTCCKHFPGLGSASGDTHLGFVDISESWTAYETEPYFQLNMHELCPMIMTTHAFNRQLDEKYPATLSQKTIGGLLRNDLHYDGVVISDDMQMRAISDHYSLKESLCLGINAGIDLFCFGNNLLEERIEAETLIGLVTALVKEGSVKESQIDESLSRIQKIRDFIS